MRTLEERLEADEPEIWEAEEGDSIFGEVEEISTREGDYGPYQVVTLYNADGAFNVACWDTVCANKLEELDPHVGDNLGFKYLGLKAPKKAGAKPYKNWRLVLSRATAAPAADVPVPEFPEEGDEED